MTASDGSIIPKYKRTIILKLKNLKKGNILIGKWGFCLFEIIIFFKASCFISVFVDEHVYKCVFVLNWTYMIIQSDNHSVRPHCNIVYSVEPALNALWTVRRYIYIYIYIYAVQSWY